MSECLPGPLLFSGFGWTVDGYFGRTGIDSTESTKASWSKTPPHSSKLAKDMMVPRFRILTLIGLCLFGSSCHIGQRMLTVQVQVDRQVVLRGFRAVRDDMPVDDMWSVLEDVQLEVADSSPPLSGQRDDSLTLDGNVVVRILHTDQELITTSVPSLTLTRNAEKTGWSLSESDLERILQSREE